MKKLLAIGFSAALFFASAEFAVAGDATTNLKVGVIDVREILATSPKAVQVGEKLKKEFQAREDKLRALSQDIQTSSEKFERNRAVMGEEEKKKMERDLMANQRELARLQAEFRDDSQLRQREEMQKFLESLKEVVTKLAKDEKYDIVLHSEAAPYANDKVDITKKVLKLLDEKKNA